MSKSREAKEQSKALRTYLTAYNALSFFGWLYVLYLCLQHLSGGTKPSGLDLLKTWPLKLLFRPTYAPIIDLVSRAGSLKTHVQPTLKIVQSWAILELLHVALGLVPSSLMTTGIQVFSRLYLTWCVCEVYPTNSLYASMVLSWAVTEIIRYAYYVCNGLQIRPPRWLTYLRYTTFIALYPIGASSEAFLIFSTLPPLGSVAPSMAGWSVSQWIRAVLFVSWWPGLLNQMSHMFVQRRKVLYKIKSKVA